MVFRGPSWRLPFDDPARTGVPLPGRTVEHAVSQLIWRVLGPVSPATRPMLTWAAGGVPLDAATGVEWTPRHLAYRIAQVRTIGRTTPVHSDVAAELTAPEARSVEQVRARQLFAVPSPTRRRGGIPDAWLRHDTVTAVRVLTAVGPMAGPALQAAVARTHLGRTTPIPTVADLEEGLTHVGAHQAPDTGYWAAPTGSTPWPRDTAFLQAAVPGVVYRRSEIAALLHQAGYAAVSAGTAVVDHHPLIVKTGRGRYRLLEPGDGSGTEQLAR